ncbi:MAG: biotin-dependent carboxyltransferase family protein [Fimbriimonadaceae bacterium]
MGLRVLRVQAGASLQDSGRPGYRRFGVPQGGAFDLAALEWGNALLGNPPGAPALELLLFGGRFRAESALRVAVVGAPCAVRVDGREAPWGRPVGLQPGSELEIGLATEGLRVLLCAEGGFEAERILGSVSGHPVGTGDILRIGRASGEPARAEPPPWDTRLELAVDAGPDAVLLPPGLLDGAFEASHQSGRSGVRLVGAPPLALPELPSEPCDVGVVQATPSGELVVIGPDGPTIGGYSKVACVPEGELWKVAQLRPGETVRLKPREGWG